MPTNLFINCTVKVKVGSTSALSTQLDKPKLGEEPVPFSLFTLKL